MEESNSQTVHCRKTNHYELLLQQIKISICSYSYSSYYHFFISWRNGAFETSSSETNDATLTFSKVIDIRSRNPVNLSTYAASEPTIR